MSPDLIFQYVVAIVVGILVGVGLGGFFLCFMVFLALMCFGWLFE